MTETLLRGRLLTFHRDPQGADDTEAYTYIEDAGLLMRDGLIAARGSFAEVRAQAPHAPVTDHRPHLMMAGFIDTHIHFPQVQVIASWGAQLLDWLNGYTFPEETRFADPAHAARMAQAFLDLLTAHGTTTAVSFCSVHAASAEALFAEATRRDMRMLAGKVMMDRNAPDGLRDTAQCGYDDSKALIDRWHGKGRNGYVITPRFAITSTPEQLQMAGALSAEHPECHVQTHLSENRAEIAYTAELYPEARDYLDVYEGFGLLGPKTLLGHAIHPTPREIDTGLEGFRWWPETPAFDRWLALYLRAARANGGTPDAGRRLLAWAHEAGLEDVVPGSSTWLHATPESRTAWAATWSGRITSAPLATQLEREGWADEAEREAIAEAFRTWARDPDGWFVLLHGEILARA